METGMKGGTNRQKMWRVELGLLVSNTREGTGL